MSSVESFLYKFSEENHLTNLKVLKFEALYILVICMLGFREDI